MSARSHPSGNLIEKIVEQGQRLRNDMVKTILSYDPFYSELCPENGRKNPAKNLSKRSDALQSSELTLLQAYLKGNEMSASDEKIALATLAKIPADRLSSDLFRLKELESSVQVEHQNYCNCKICTDFNKLTKVAKKSLCSLTSNLKVVKSAELAPIGTAMPREEPKVESFVASKNIASRSTEEILIRNSPLKFVDSMKIYLHNIRFHEAGKRKLLGANSSSKYPLSNKSMTYFIEYSIPSILLGTTLRPVNKLHLNPASSKLVRFCSKKSLNEAIYFKQESIHPVKNMHMLDLNKVEIAFTVKVRHMNHRLAEDFGTARFKISSVLGNPHLSSDQELIILGSGFPVVLGSLKVSIQLGCDKLHFGKGFIDAINCSKINVNLPMNDSVFREKVAPRKDFNFLAMESERTDQNERKHIVEKVEIVENKITLLLFGLIYVPEVKYVKKHPNSFLKCRAFLSDVVFYSIVLPDHTNPVFNFYQLVPLLYNDDFFDSMRDNFLILECWQKEGYDEKLIGVCKLPLNAYFVAYRNPDIVRHLINNKLPVISTDRWEPIINIEDQSECGRAASLIAVGTEKQIEHLNESRGYNAKCIKARAFNESLNSTSSILLDLSSRKICSSPVSETKLEKSKKSDLDAVVVGRKIETSKNSGDLGVVFNDRITDLTKKKVEFSKEVSPTVQKNLRVDLGVQTNQTVDCSVQCDDMEGDSPTPALNYSGLSRNELLNVFLQQLGMNPAENAQKTATASVCTQTEVKQQQRSLGEDVITSLQEAFDKSSDCFKALVVIERALHLPARKKCKSKRSKNKGKEEILPSTYVTLEMPNASGLIKTDVFPKSTSPVWDFRCDVCLPIDFLLNEQKKLIFKVWRKSSSLSLQPNLNTDMIVGFAAVDLTVLLSGLPNIQGWFNLVDFSSKCNGQLKLTVTPLENVTKYQHLRTDCNNRFQSDARPTSSENSLKPQQPQQHQHQPIADNQSQSPSESLSRTLKRKFTELDEITQRLKLRLSNVTNDDDNDDDSDNSNDEFSAQFERDLNTAVFEEHQLQQEQQLTEQQLREKFLELQGSVSSRKMDCEGEKARIDSLLEKLTLVNGSPSAVNGPRYVSGCSVDAEMQQTVSETNISDTILTPENSASLTNTSDETISNERLEPEGFRPLADKDVDMMMNSS